MSKCLLLLAFLAVAAPQVACGHGLFWQASPDGPVLMEGHLPGQEHGGEAAAPCAPGRVRVLLVARAGGTWVEADVPADGPVVAPADAAGVCAVVDWGWWTKTAAGTRNVHPDSVAGALQAWTSLETVTQLAPGGAPAPGPAGRGLEITPVRALGGLGAGDKLDLRVTLDGRPVAGAVVTYDGKARGTSRQDGSIRLKLRRPGPQLIRASLRRPAAAPAWAEDVQTATLMFPLEDR